MRLAETILLAIIATLALASVGCSGGGDDTDDYSDIPCIENDDPEEDPLTSIYGQVTVQVAGECPASLVEPIRIRIYPLEDCVYPPTTWGDPVAEEIVGEGDSYDLEIPGGGCYMVRGDDDFDCHCDSSGLVEVEQGAAVETDLHLGCCCDAD
jgi:hypothetical protein